jgi:hypothetical protein
VSFSEVTPSIPFSVSVMVPSPLEQATTVTSGGPLDIQVTQIPAGSSSKLEQLMKIEKNKVSAMKFLILNN